MNRLKLYTHLFFLFSVVPFIGQLNPVIIATTAFLYFFAILHSFKIFEIKPFLKFFLLFSSFILLISFFGEFRGLETGVALLLTLTVIKMFELNEKRDYYLFFVIDLLMMVGQLLTVYSLFMVGYVVIYVFFLYLFINFLNSKNDTDTIRKERLKSLRQVLLWSIPAGMVLFFLFPRLLVGNLFFNTVKETNKTGFIEQLNPGSLSEVINDPTPVFRANFLAGKRPSLPEMYWRGGVLGLTDGFNWQSGNRGATLQSIKSNRRPIVNYEINFEEFQSSNLFLLKNSHNIRNLSRSYIKRGVSGTYVARVLSNQKLNYRASTYKSVPLKNQNALTTYLQLPSNFDQTQFYKWSQQNKFKTAQEYIDFFKEYISTQKFSYSLRPGPMNPQNQIDDFFFKKKIGLCEHYASSLALFLRSNNIASRIVVGFHGGIYNDLSDYFIIRNEDAHAWVEYWNPKKGWILSDPTAYIVPERIRLGAFTFNQLSDLQEGEGIDEFFQRKNSSFFQRFKFATDMIYFKLNNSFQNFDYETQKSFFEKMNVSTEKFRIKLISLVAIILGIFSGIIIYYLNRRKIKYPLAHRVYMDLCKKLSKKHGIWLNPTINPRIQYQNLQKANIYSESGHQQWDQFALNYNELMFNNKRDLKADRNRIKELKQLKSHFIREG